MARDDYRMLAEFRERTRSYLRFSEQAARRAGLEAQQYQLLLALKGLPKGVVPSIGELATRLLVEHHSAVGLVDRLEARGLLRRRRDEQDGRRIILDMTPQGERTIQELASVHQEELRKMAPDLIEALARIIGARAAA
jgi:DNA-binding MarR family transcriptional regulator